MVIYDPNVPYFKSMINGDNPNDRNVPAPVSDSTDPVPSVWAIYVPATGIDYYTYQSPATVNKIFTNLYNDGNQSWNNNVEFVWWYTLAGDYNIPLDGQGYPTTTNNQGTQIYTPATRQGGEVPLLSHVDPNGYGGALQQRTQCMCREVYGSGNGNRNTQCVWPNNDLLLIRKLGWNLFGGNFFALATKHSAQDGCGGGASRVLFLRASSLNSLPFISGSALLTPSDDGLTMNMNATVQPSLTSIGNVSLYQFPSGIDTLNWTPSQATATTTLTPSQLVSAYNYQPSTSALNIAFPLTNTQQALVKSVTQDGSFFVAVFDMTNGAGTQPAMRSNVLQLSGSGPLFPFGIVFGSLLAIGVVFIGIKMMKNK